MPDLKRTPLYDEHLRLGAKLVPFAGFEMPVQYPGGIRAEHAAVRQAAGMFDVSHMGEFRIRGSQAVDLVSHVTTNDPSSLATGQAQYSVMCHEHGGIVDDLIVYRHDEDDLLLIVNASNIQKDWSHISSHLGAFDAGMIDESDETGLIALQGPRADETLAGLTEIDLGAIGFYHFAVGDVTGVRMMVSRTGYTGESGFELYLPAAAAADVWRRLEAAGSDVGLVAAGLGARDTLRLEVGYALYGNDLDDETSPLEARLSWLVKLDKGDFVGRDALRAQKDEGVGRRLSGFRLTERGFPRAGYEVVFRDSPVGKVRSGTMSPSLGFGIGTAYLPSDAEAGESLQVIIRGREIAGQVAGLPFYKEGSLKR